MKNYTNKIREALSNYQKEIDRLVMAYNAEKKAFDDELNSMRGKYTDNYINESKSNWKPRQNYSSAISTERAKTSALCNRYMGLMKKSIDSFFNAPLSADFANKIMALKTVGVKLSNVEFEMLANNANSYMAKRLLNGLAENRATSQTTIEMDENGTPRAKNVEMPSPYRSVKVPDMDSVYITFNSMQNHIENALCYSGQDLELCEYAGCGKDDFIKHNQAAVAIRSIRTDNQAYSDFEDSISDLVDDNKATLSQDDKHFIDLLIDTKYPSLAQDRAVDLAKADSNIASMLMLDERYSDSVIRALEI